MKIIESYKDLVGNTPLFRAKNLESSLGLDFKLLLKLDMFNPTRSSKDRATVFMIRDAEKRGMINKDTLIIEPTSGNTGIGLAAYSLSRGYRTILCMPETMSKERRDVMQAYGAEIVLTDGAKGMKGAIEKAMELKEEYGNAFIPSQFDNKANSLAHYTTTGKEIWDATEGNVDYFVAGVGTGGTITGVSHFFKEKKGGFKSFAVEPANSAVLSGEPSGKHAIQGIGAGFVPSILDENCYDGVIKVEDEESKNMMRKILKYEGLLVGISSGAAVAATIKLSKQEKLSGKNVVVFLPDTGERYISTGVLDVKI